MVPILSATAVLSSTGVLLGIEQVVGNGSNLVGIAAIIAAVGAIITSVGGIILGLMRKTDDKAAPTDPEVMKVLLKLLEDKLEGERDERGEAQPSGAVVDDRGDRRDRTSPGAGDLPAGPALGGELGGQPSAGRTDHAARKPRGPSRKGSEDSS